VAENLAKLKELLERVRRFFKAADEPLASYCLLTRVPTEPIWKVAVQVESCVCW
jgi:hypothetical protein